MLLNMIIIFFLDKMQADGFNWGIPLINNLKDHSKSVFNGL